VPRQSTPPLRTVQGFTVHADIADDVDAMLTAAAADGVRFGGSAYRSTQRQIELRIANCGPTEYDIWYRPASSCSPPTAVPGRSLHEQGRALDLTYDGRLITSRANLGFQWLAANAASYGLFNLPSEPWHWSTTGG
jgi:LAS superfamily LD-carboxypeptidase LdcB